MKVLLVDDDADLLAVAGMALRQEGFEVIPAGSVAAALRAFHQQAPAAAILDINLPDGNGFDLCAALRRESALPILMLTARTDEADQLRALALEADDYLTKPYSPRTLVARLRAVLRRTGGAATRRHRLGQFELDAASLELSVAGHTVRLTPRESLLMQALISRGGSVAAAALLEAVWGEADQDRQLLKQLVHRLRLKLEAAGLGDDLLETVPNVGYRLRT